MSDASVPRAVGVSLKRSLQSIGAGFRAIVLSFARGIALTRKFAILRLHRNDKNVHHTFIRPKGFSIMKLKNLLVFAVIAFAAVANVNGGYDIYVWTETPFLAGEVTVAPSGGVCPIHCGPGAWQLFSFSWGVSHPVQVGGGPPGQPSFSDLSLLKKLDSASVGALLKVAQGSPFGAVYLSFVENSGAPFLSYEIKMETVYFSSIQHSGSAGGDDRPTESVSFSYGKITWTYYPRPSPGNPNPPAITHFWNLVTNTGG